MNESFVQPKERAATGPPGREAGALLTIDLGALAANWRLLRDRAQGAECAAVVKADGYGIGVREAARALSKAGCRTFFVAQVSEGVAAREACPEFGHHPRPRLEHDRQARSPARCRPNQRDRVAA